VLISFKVVMFLGYFTHNAAIPYYTRHGLMLSDTWIASVYLARTLTTIASQPFWSWVARRIGRRDMLLAAAITEMLCFMVWFFVTPENAARAIVPLGLVQGLSSGGLFFGLYTALPDTMEYDRRRSGLQREGVFAGIFVMVEKFVAAIASGMFGVTIGLLGYLEGKDAVAIVQPHSAVQGIFIALSVVPTLLALCACFILRYYRLEDADLKSTSLQPS
jgi:Na+/melibiose symporter-like transporter